MWKLAMLLACASARSAPEAPLQRYLARISEEAEVFARLAPRLVAEETLVQRARKIRRGFPIRIGEPRPPAIEYTTREIVSEYGFGACQGTAAALCEFRQIVTVDGRPVAGARRARERLVLGLRSAEDRERKRMLERFEKYGFKDAATDFGQVLLLFTRTRLVDYDFRILREDRLGADNAIVLGFAQRGGSGGVLILENKEAVRRPFEGEVWVRARDGLPLRVRLRVERATEHGALRDEADVDYVTSSHNVIVPAAVSHRRFSGDDLLVENVFRYSTFRMFSAEAEIKFQ